MAIVVPTPNTTITSAWGKSVADAINAVYAAPSATPPASAVDGQLWAMAPTAGVMWLFRYNAAAGTYKWEFVGGSPWIGYDASSGAPAAGSWALGAPAVVLPRAGIYTASCICEATATAAMRVWMGVTAAAAAAVFTNSGPTVAAGSFVVITAPERESTVTAGATLSAAYTATAAGATVSNRQIRVTPRAIS